MKVLNRWKPEYKCPICGAVGNYGMSHECRNGNRALHDGTNYSDFQVEPMYDQLNKEILKECFDCQNCMGIDEHVEFCMKNITNPKLVVNNSFLEEIYETNNTS